MTRRLWVLDDGVSSTDRLPLTSWEPKPWYVEYIPRPRWIPVGERLPEPGYYLTEFDRCRGPRSCWVSELGGDGKWRDEEGNVVEPTHWQPLPEGPDDDPSEARVPGEYRETVFASGHAPDPRPAEDERVEFATCAPTPMVRQTSIVLKPCGEVNKLRGMLRRDPNREVTLTFGDERHVFRVMRWRDDVGAIGGMELTLSFVRVEP